MTQMLCPHMLPYIVLSLKFGVTDSVTKTLKKRKIETFLYQLEISIAQGPTAHGKVKVTKHDKIRKSLDKQCT